MLLSNFSRQLRAQGVSWRSNYSSLRLYFPPRRRQWRHTKQPPPAPGVISICSSSQILAYNTRCSSSAFVRHHLSTSCICRWCWTWWKKSDLHELIESTSVEYYFLQQSQIVNRTPELSPVWNWRLLWYKLRESAGYRFIKWENSLRDSFSPPYPTPVKVKPTRNVATPHGWDTSPSQVNPPTCCQVALTNSPFPSYTLGRREALGE